VAGFLEKMAAEAGQPVADIEREFFTRARPSSLIRRFAEPAEVAALVTYVVSPLASATTGAALRVDGGIVRSPF
jgi:NAD(P)-dependent dehydrogenase (short-subunit alcohol dehydrogenase family)